mmetsp:Transcript_5001/g.11692  ORF Transcript_5001/g.11692 Transcript_5001/m.11692 type:complete len:209 (+) Transcript_5001:119-745(+)
MSCRHQLVLRASLKLASWSRPIPTQYLSWLIRNPRMVVSRVHWPTAVVKSRQSRSPPVGLISSAVSVLSKGDDRMMWASLEKAHETEPTCRWHRLGNDQLRRLMWSTNPSEPLCHASQLMCIVSSLSNTIPAGSAGSRETSMWALMWMAVMVEWDASIHENANDRNAPSLCSMCARRILVSLLLSRVGVVRLRRIHVLVSCAMMVRLR